MVAYDKRHAQLDSREYREARVVRFERWPGRQLPKLPPSLQILTFDDSRVEVFPDLPRGVREVRARKGRIGAVPRLTQNRQLEVLELSDHRIRSVGALPASLRTLDLSFNLLEFLDALPDGLAFANLSFNKLRDRVRAPPACTRNLVQAYATEYVLHLERVARGWKPATATDPSSARRPVYPSSVRRTVYQNGENVHAPSVQKTVSTSVQALREACADAVMATDHVTRVARLVEPWWATRCAGRHPVRAWCRDDLVHGEHGVTFDELLRMVWTVVRDLQRVLRDELRASVGHCFTGRCSRVVNALTGFVEGVGVGVSEKEQMQSRIAALAAKGGDGLRDAAAAVLDEFGVTDPAERGAWLDALE